jgi:hypothetical protein
MLNFLADGANFIIAVEGLTIVAIAVFVGYIFDVLNIFKKG